MRRFIPAIAILLCFQMSVLAQNPNTIRTNHWLFGWYNHIDFTSGEAELQEPIDMRALEASSSISDFDGDLLFYTNGEVVFEADGDTMPNGIGLIGGSSSRDGAIIVPKPGSTDLYYIIHCNSFQNAISSDYYYSIVDMSIGEGIVIEKNILFQDDASERLAVTQHANGIDFWIMTQQLSVEGCRAFLLTEEGLSLKPVHSLIGGTAGETLGSFRFAPNGCKFALTNYSNGTLVSTIVADFDNATGVLSNEMHLGNLPSVGQCFSPNSQLLYVPASNSNSSLSKGGDIVQYDLSYATEEEIEDNVYSVAVDWMSPGWGGIQIGPNGKVYGQIVYGSTNEILFYEIENPNVPGEGCSINLEDAVVLHGYASRFPLYVDSWLNVNEENLCQGNLSVSQNDDVSMSVYPNPTRGVLFLDMPEYSQVAVFNMLGEKVLEVEVEGGKIDLSGLEKGMYFMKYSKLVERVIIQ